jgi:methionyl-tRNA synthetase
MSETNIINFNDWQKLDLRVGKILKVDDIEGADKLYKLEIDLGKEIGKRILVAGLKPHYKKDKLKNHLCIVFINLEPRTLRGIMSQGMILASVSEEKDGKEFVKLLQPDDDMKLGSKVR